VLIDNVDGARQAVDHLIAHGHHRIAMLGDDPTIYTVPERLRGYREALAAAGIAEDPALVRLGHHDAESAEQTAIELLATSDPPTAIFAGNNRIVVGGMRAVHRHPGRVALIGFDDLELAEIVAAPLTVLAHNPAQMGVEAVQLLWRRLDGVAGPAERVVLPTRLIPRGSGEVSPGFRMHDDRRCGAAVQPSLHPRRDAVFPGAGTG
jgi:LacI family transcriptional regulator